MFANTKIESPYYYIYEIKKGDTLYKLSKEFNVNTMILSELNGLNIDDYIYPGQMVLIPKKDVSYYITKEGDTLKLISKTFNVSEEEIIKNNETIYVLPGQMIYYKR